MRLDDSGVIKWCLRPGGFLKSPWSSTHIGKWKKLHSDGSEACDNNSNDFATVCEAFVLLSKLASLWHQASHEGLQNVCYITSYSFFLFFWCVCVHMFSNMSSGIQFACQWRSSVLPMALHLIFWVRVSQWTWSSQNWLQWLPCAAPEPQGSTCLPLQCCNSQTHAAMLRFLSFFCVFSEIFLGSLHLHAKYFTWSNPATSFLFFPLFTRLLNAAFLSPPRCTLASRHEESLAAF